MGLIAFREVLTHRGTVILLILGTVIMRERWARIMMAEHANFLC